MSRKTHGSVGTFDIPSRLTGSSGVECRSGGSSSNYQIVATFTDTVSFNSVTVTSGSGTVAGLSASGNQIIVNLTHVANDQTIVVTLSGVKVTLEPNTYIFAIPMGVLVDDKNGDRIVDSLDVSQTNARIGNAVIQSTFRNDVNFDDVIANNDVALIQRSLGKVLH